jgi:hypothetical protein
LLGLAALGELFGQALATLRPWLSRAGLVVPALCGFGFIKLQSVSLADLAQSAHAIGAQQVSLARWAAAALPRDARLGVNDAGAVAFYSGRPTFDVVGLTTRGEARYWVAGAGSRFEHYERLSRARLPSYFLVYPEWFAIPSLLGECLAERSVYGATILGGTRMVACRADYASLGSGAEPTTDVGSRQRLDELDVADLESEAEHGYVLGPSSAQYDVVVEAEGRVDGGRSQRSLEQFALEVAGGGLLVVRFGSDAPTQIAIAIRSAPSRSVTAAAGSFQELAFEVPPATPRGRARLTLRSQLPLTCLHYWSYGPR